MSKMLEMAYFISPPDIYIIEVFIYLVSHLFIYGSDLLYALFSIHGRDLYM